MTSESIRLFIFLTALLTFSLLEFKFSYQKRNLKRIERWPGNLLIIFLSSFAAKFITPSGLAFFSLKAQNLNWGLFNIIELNPIVEIFLSIILLDFLIYFQHVLSHKIHFLWRFHRVHHADIDLDTTSALRFHPVEIILSIGFKILLIFIFGFSVESVFLFEIILNFMAMFNHSNLRIAKSFETKLRKLIVTPQMHLIHHSTEQFESDSNYGFNLSIWDRIFKTYTEEFKSSGIIGQNYYRSKKEHGIIALLTLPFRNKTW